MNEHQINTDKGMTLMTLGEGHWYYNPKAENPHRFWLGKYDNISHMHLFEICDDKSEIPIAQEMCFFERAFERSHLQEIIQAKITTRPLKFRLVRFILGASVEDESVAELDDHIKLLLASEEELGNAILKTLDLWKREYDTFEEKVTIEPIISTPTEGA